MFNTTMNRQLCGPQSHVAFGLAFLLSLSGCGPELDPISEVKTLRIMAVSKTAPYAKPGETVDLQMLWEDGRAELPDKVESFFGFWCVNPPGNTYSECLTTPPSVNPPVFVANQNNFQITIPEDALRPSPYGPNLPDSGTAFVYYGICAGTLDLSGLSAPAASGEDLGEAYFPKCLDDAGNELGPDDFIIGYSTIFIYEDLRNENPLLTGFRVGGEEVSVDCLDSSCDEPFETPALSACESGVACLKACPDDADPVTCPMISLEALIDPASAEADELAAISYGTEVEESIWVSYFSDRGRISPEVKLVNDGTVGWQSNFSTGIYAPSEPGPLRLWAVVRDNRGGVAWLRVPAFVEE